MKLSRTLLTPLLAALMLALPMSASADPWKDESGHGHERHKKHRYWDGNCMVETKMKKDGEYVQKRKCKPPKHVYHEPVPVYVSPPPAVIVEPGITIHGTARLP